MLLLGNLVMLGGAVFVGVEGGVLLAIVLAPVAILALTSILRQIARMRRG